MEHCSPAGVAATGDEREGAAAGVAAAITGGNSSVDAGNGELNIVSARRWGRSAMPGTVNLILDGIVGAVITAPTVVSISLSAIESAVPQCENDSGPLEVGEDTMTID